MLKKKLIFTERMIGLFEYDEEYYLKTLKLDGIVFGCDEEKDGYEEKAIRLAAAYKRKLPDIVDYLISDRLDDFYGEVYGTLTNEFVRSKLGTPLIDLDCDAILYLGQELDDEHLIRVEFSGDFDQLMYCTIDG